MSKFVAVLFFWGAYFSSTVLGAPTYNEVDGICVFEAESTTLAGKWVLNTSALAQFTGTGGIDYPGPVCTTTLNAAGTDPIYYSFKINNPGKYWVRLRMYHCCTNRGDIDNDQWIKIDALNWYKYYHNGPGGAGCRPANYIVGMSSSGTDATNTDQTWFNLTAGVHTLGISSRSFNCMIDRINICKDSVKSADATLPVSEVVGTRVIESMKLNSIGEKALSLKGNVLKVNLTKRYTVQVVSLDGRVAGTFTGDMPGVYSLSTATSASGMFFAKVSTNRGMFTVPLVMVP